MYAFRFLGSTFNCLQLTTILNAQIRLPIAILLNQSRQVLQQQQLTAIPTDKNNAINQAVDRLDKRIALFYLLLFGSLAQLESNYFNYNQ